MSESKPVEAFREKKSTGKSDSASIETARCKQSYFDSAFAIHYIVDTYRVDRTY